jgi:hypothetical protein
MTKYNKENDIILRYEVCSSFRFGENKKANTN